MIKEGLNVLLIKRNMYGFTMRSDSEKTFYEKTIDFLHCSL